jgi:hypothetical protein
VWKRIAAPLVGGIFTSFVLELVVDTAIHEICKWHFELNRGRAEPQPRALVALLSPEGDAVTTCPASESGECTRTIRVFAHTTTGAQDAPESLASLFPCPDRSDSDTASVGCQFLG